MKHKTALVTAISVVTVVLAGATAMAANVGILKSSGEVGSLSVVSANATTLPVKTGTPEVVSYQITGVGVITLSRDGDNLTIESANVGAWSYEVAGQSDGVEVMFRLADREVAFKATVSDGQILVSVDETDVIVQNSANATTLAPSPSLTDEDDDDSVETEHYEGPEDDDD